MASMYARSIQDLTPQVKMLEAAARNYAKMVELNRAGHSSYAEWKVMSEFRQLLVYDLEYMSYEQFGAVMEHMAGEYYTKNEEEVI